MGANQSSSAGSGASAPQNAAEVKTSYYELLSLDRQATEDEIKKAYRRKALELHPDRNYGDVDRATKLFAEVQTAYEVLSDPQERAWYDSHEQIILRGGEPEDQDNYEANMGITSVEEIIAMQRKFSRNVEFTDSSSGFFGFIRETFEKLAKEEASAAMMQGAQVTDYPSFGHKDDDYEGVVKGFYAIWISFATVKSFSWKHKYRKSDAEDRFMRRAIDKENARFAEQGKREFNDAVRSLVAFVRKRDPRYAPNTQTADERAKAMRDAAKAQAARQRLENEAKLSQAVPEWATRRDPDELEESEEEEVEEEHYECMACRKTFKSEKQFDAHEKSKKHQKAVQALKQKMRKENAHLGLDDELSTDGVATPIEAEVEEKVHEDSEPDLAKAAPEELAEDLNNLSIDSDAEGVPIEADSDPASDSNANASDDESSMTSETQASTPQVSELDFSKDDKPTPQVPKRGKAAQKRAKKAAQQAAADQDELKFKCAVCAAGFPSKTRMHQHIKDFDHATPIQSTKKGANGKGKKGKAR